MVAIAIIEHRGADTRWSSRVCWLPTKPRTSPEMTGRRTTPMASNQPAAMAIIRPARQHVSIWDTSVMNPKVLSSRTLDHTETTSPNLVASRSARFVVAIFPSGVTFLLDNSESTNKRERIDADQVAPILISFSPNEDQIALEYPDGRIVTTDLATREIANYAPFSTKSLVLQTGTYRMIAITREGNIWIYDRTSHAQCVGHIEEDSVRGASLDPSERFIGIAGESGNLYLYDMNLCHWAK